MKGKWKSFSSHNSINVYVTFHFILLHTYLHLAWNGIPMADERRRERP